MSVQRARLTLGMLSEGVGGDKEASGKQAKLNDVLWSSRQAAKNGRNYAEVHDMAALIFPAFLRTI
jgi:hypothetical protein